ncbi:Txe/YoeB family addiction module toxin [Clostridia bacterium]|nr:Txe/YoeB family addiction module toxin [Clostridia bacterium]
MFLLPEPTKDIEKIKNSNFVKKTIGILGLLENNPYQNPPPYEKLIGDLAGAYSRRINIKHRVVYQVMEKEKIIKILSMWSRYD